MVVGRGRWGLGWTPLQQRHHHHHQQEEQQQQERQQRRQQQERQLETLSTCLHKSQHQQRQQCLVEVKHMQQPPAAMAVTRGVCWNTR